MNTSMLTIDLQVVGGDQRRVLAMTTLQSPIGQEIYFVLDVDYMAGLTSISWNWSKRKVGSDWFLIA